jgi:hypothetical protein
MPKSKKLQEKPLEVQFNSQHFRIYAATKRVFVQVYKTLKSPQSLGQKGHPQTYELGIIFEA